MMENHPHVTNLPDQVRCSSHPIGLRSSFRLIHRRRKLTAKTGVQKVFSAQTCFLEGGFSCQPRRRGHPASLMLSNNPRKEITVTAPSATNHSTRWRAEMEARRCPQAPSKSDA